MFKLGEIHVGLYEKAMPDALPWEDKFRMAAEAGYSHIELSIDESDVRLARLDWTQEQIEALRALAERYKLAIPTMCLSAHRRFPFGSADAQTREKAAQIMNKAILLAQRLGIRCIQLAAYDVYYEPSDARTRQRFIEGMRESAALAAGAGVMLAMEIMDTPFVGTISRALEICAQVQSPYFQIYPDMGNLSRFSDDVTGELQKGIAHIAAIHIKDTRPGEFKCVPFGEGTVRFPEIFRCLRKLDYRGLFLVEMWAEQADSYSTALEHICAARCFALAQMRAGGYAV